MPYLAALLGSAFSGLVAYLTQFIGKRIALAATVGLAFVAGWLALDAAMYAFIQGLNYTMPAAMQKPLAFVSYCLPDNFDICFNTCLAATAARWIWDRQQDYMTMVTRG